MRMGVTLALACTLGTACSSLAPRVDPGRQTALMKRAGTVMSTVELRQRVDTMVPPILAVIEQTADRIRAEATDPGIRRRALLLKIDAIPVVYRAAYQPDPLAALLDLWLLTYQMEDCLQVGEGPCSFGPQQPIGIEAARELREKFEETVFIKTLDPETLEDVRGRIREIARRVPLTGEGAIARRYTMTAEVAEIVGSQEGDAFSMIGDVSMTLSELSHRLNTYIGGAGDLGRWQAELLVEDVLERPEVEATRQDVHRTAGDVARLSESLEGIEGTLGPEGVEAILAQALALVREERKAVLADVERQRNLTLAYVSNERRIVLEAVNAQREVALAQIHQERVDSFVDLDRLGRQYLDHTTARALRVVDHLVWRVAQLLVGLLLLAAFLAWLVLRTTRGRGAVPVGKSPGEMSS